MTPLGLGAGFYGLGPTINSDNATLVAARGTAVRVTGGDGLSPIADDEGVYFEASVLQSTFQASFTIAFWIKVDDGQGSGSPYLFGNLGDGTHACNAYRSTDGKINFNFKGNSDEHVNRTNAAVFADGANAYKHIAVTMTKVGGDNSVSKIYVDGVEAATTIQSSKEITEANHEAWDDDVFMIGALGTHISGLGGDFSTQGVNADIAEFAIWNVALGDAAVAAVEDLGVPTASNFPDLTASSGSYTAQGNLVTYHKLNDYSGAVANESISGNHGTLIGASVFV